MSVNPAPVEPAPNKAVVAAVGTIVTVLLRWAVSHKFTLTDEGLVALAGAITTVAVYAVSNYWSILSRRGNTQAGGAVAGLILAILLAFVAYLVAVALGLPWVVALILALLGVFAGWVIGNRHAGF